MLMRLLLVLLLRWIHSDGCSVVVSRSLSSKAKQSIVIEGLVPNLHIHVRFLLQITGPNLIIIT